jgi:uncharacterized protein DUF1236
MRNQRTTFLAGIAALALIAGAGSAMAEDSSPGQKGAVQPHAATATKTDHERGSGGSMGQTKGAGTENKAAQEQTLQKGMNKTESAPKGEAKTGEAKTGEAKTGKSSERMNQSAAEKGAGPNAKEPNRRAEEMNRSKANKENLGENKGNTGEMDQDRAAQSERTKGTGSSAEERRPGSPNTAESRDPRLRGLQGNASGVTLNTEQRTRIRETVINARGAPRIGSVDFDVAVGTEIPRGRIHVVPVPEMLVDIQPAWRGFLYFIVRDELVIVDPNDMRIVAVVPV